MSDLGELIASYIDHLDDPDYWTRILADHAGEEVDAALVEMMGSGEPPHIDASLLFLEDWARVAPWATAPSGHLERPRPPAITRALEQLVACDQLRARMSAVVVIARIGAVECLPVLCAALENNASSDPILAVTLCSEIAWLRGRDLDLVQRCLLRSPCSFSRWAGLQILDAWRVTNDARGRMDVREELRAAAGDLDPRVAQTARFVEDVMDLEDRLPAISGRSERRSLRRALEARQPLDFWRLSQLFQLDMEARGAADYTLSELEAFAEALAPR